MSVYLKLMKVQSELKAPKSQTNAFGKYKYRSCEDILESVKSLLLQHKALIIIRDDIEHIEGRYYVRAIATFIDAETGEKIEVSANAREPENKKGMDESQITGAASSYARKYALNGLLAIDDTKDDDATNEGDKKPNTPNTTKPVAKTQQTKPSEPVKELAPAKVKALYTIATKNGYTQDDIHKGIKKKYNIETTKHLTVEQFKEMCKGIEANPKNKEEEKVETK